MSAATGPGDDLEAELTGELERLADRRIAHAFNPQRGQEPLNIPRLTELAQQLEPQQWQADRVAALTRLVGTAAAAIPRDRVRPETEATWEQFAHSAYNLAGDSLAHVDGHRYTFLLDRFFSSAGLEQLPSRTRGHDARRLRAKLAAALSTMQQEYVRVLEDHPQVTEGGDNEESAPHTTEPRRHVSVDGVPLWTSSYVPRAAIQDQFRSYVSTGQRLITLVGQPGSGKSRAAYEFAEQYAQVAGLPGIWLDGSSEYFLRAGIIRHLRLIGVDVPEEADRLHLSFFAMLCGSPEVSVVVIDNLSNPELLLRVVPRPPTALVLVTSELPCQPSFAGGQIAVTPMSDDEAFELASQLMPSVRQDSQRHLAYALGLLPLAIAHAAGLLNGSFGIDTEQLIELLEADPSEVLEIEVIENHRALSVVYSSIVDRLRREAPAAWQVLCILSAIHASKVPSDLVNDIYVSLLEQGDAQPSLSAGPISGIATLTKMQIVQARDDGFSMNSLAWRLITRHTSTEHVRVARSAYPLLRQRLAKVRETTETSSTPDVLYAAALGLMWNYSNDDIGTPDDGELGEMLAQIAAGLNRRGGSNDLLRWVMRSPLAHELIHSGRLQRLPFKQLVAQLRPTLITGAGLSPEPPVLYADDRFQSEWLDTSGNLDKEAVASRPVAYLAKHRGFEVCPTCVDDDDVGFEFPRGLADYEHGEPSFLDDSAKWYADHGYWGEAEKRYDELGTLAAAPEYAGLHFIVQAQLGKAEVEVWRRKFGTAAEALYALTHVDGAIEGMPHRQSGYMNEVTGDLFRLLICNTIAREGVMLKLAAEIPIDELYRGAIGRYGDFNDHPRMAVAELKLAAFLAYRDIDAASERVRNVRNYLAADRPGHLRLTVLALKLRFLSKKFNTQAYELAWRCAAVATRTFDWYWRAESLLMAHLGGRQLGVEADDLRLLDHAVRRAYNRLQRPDRVSILERGVDSASGRVDLLTD